MGTLRILVVDDDPDFAESLADVLRLPGHHVECASSGEESIDRLRNADYDLTFMDVKMPGRNGVESFLAIHRFKPDARVVMMTGYSVDQLLQQAVDNGAWDVLTKPFDPAKAMSMVEKIMPAGILIADDDPATVETIGELLTGRGYRVFVARDGREAVERVRSGGIDVLILDLRLPVMSGLETYLELKRTGHAVPTIIITGYAGEESQTLAQLRSFPVTGILTKPFDPRQLLAMVEEFADRTAG